MKPFINSLGDDLMSLEEMKVAELKEFAEEYGIKIPSNTKKEDIKNMIEESIYECKVIMSVKDNVTRGSLISNGAQITVIGDNSNIKRGDIINVVKGFKVFYILK